MRKELNRIEIEEVKEQAQEKLGICRKTNGIIGLQVFSILGLYARVIYYPLGEDAPWGFTRISGSRNDADLEKPFVAINTSIPVSSQVFAAAHELYHIWYENSPDVLPQNLLDENGNKNIEKKANRFAAEFLLDDMMLRQEIQIYRIKTFDIKAVLQLAELFVVPYRAMVKRIFETGYIGNETRKKLLEESDDSIERYRKRYAISADKSDGRIAVDNLAELAVNAYEAGLITYEKLEYLLDICALTPGDVGIARSFDDEFPSDEELDEIMEGDE
jgi:Zn-dependent peptidase ImmA (M78 family)